MKKYLLALSLAVALGANSSAQADSKFHWVLMSSAGGMSVAAGIGAVLGSMPYSGGMVLGGSTILIGVASTIMGIYDLTGYDPAKKNQLVQQIREDAATYLATDGEQVSEFLASYLSEARDAFKKAKKDSPTDIELVEAALGARLSQCVE